MGLFISKELSVFAWKGQEELWYFCTSPSTPSWCQHYYLHESSVLRKGLCCQAWGQRVSSPGISRAISSGWDRLILQALRERRTRCHLISLLVLLARPGQDT